MAPSRRKGASKAAAAAAARRQWKVGDLVLAKVKGFPAWPATVSEPEKWGYSTDWKKVLVYFFGTQQIAFCNPADVEAFTEEKKQSLLVKRQGRGADFVRAVQEIIDSYEKSKKQDRADVINSGNEVTQMNGGNSVDSSTRNISKDEAEVLTETQESHSQASKSSGDRREPNLPVEDAVKQLDSLNEQEFLLEKPTESALVAESSLLATYTSRKRSGGSRQQNSVAQRRALPVRKSRSSSRVESGQFQNHVASHNDGSKVGGSIVANGARDGSLRRNKRIRKSPDIMDCDDRSSPALGSDVSADDIESGIVTVESDSLSLNEGSILDSGCELENSEAVECLEGDLQLRKGFGLQIKAGVMKRKRKPNKKRAMNEATEHIARLDKDAGLDGGVNDTDLSLQHVTEKANERDSKEDGDEHLPLVKRARVRMGKPSSAGEPSSLPLVEEKSLNEVAANSGGQNTSALTCISDSTTDRNSFLVKETTDNTSPSKGGTQYSGNQPHFWKVNKNQLLGCLADGEAALPPSKRLHRALEAMSANAAAEGEVRIEASTRNTSITGSCVSPMSRSPDMAAKCREVNGSELEIVDSAKNSTQVGASGFFTSSNPISSEETSSSVGGDISDKHNENFEGGEQEFDRGSAADRTFIIEGSNPIGSSAGTNVVHTVCNIGSPEGLLPNAVTGQANPICNHVSLPSRDEGGSKELESSNCRTEKCDKEFDISEYKRLIPDNLQGIGMVDKVSPEDNVKLHHHSSDGAGCENIEFLKSQVDDSCQVYGSCEAISDRVESKEEKKSRSSASVSSDDCSSDKMPSDIHLSPHPTDGVDFPAQMSSPSNLTCQIPTSESANFPKSNSCSSPNVCLDQNKICVTPVVEEGKGELVTQKTKLFTKWSNYAEARAALSSFEAILGTLTGKKESIGRATRMAIECGKLGVAAKVVEILTHTLESESSLHRRVDLFFLVDSITQCSRNMRGDVGGVYLSAIQMLLPRLLSAAAPPGSAAQENRRQCLKVLRVWLDRRILPDSVVRHHIRELDLHGGAYSAGVYSRRSSRTERSLDDPVREMEGMLVDEYGSNSSFQLPGFCMPRMRKDEDEGSDSDGGSFEAVTPEHKPATPEEQETSHVGEKHRHILEDVDGELEMEDVAPSCDVEMNAANSVANVGSSHGGSDQPVLPSCAPPPPQDVPPPPPPPPLPSSPPPPPPPPPSVPPPHAMSNSYSASVDSNIYTGTTNMQDSSLQHSSQQQSVPQHIVAPRINPTSDAVHYHAPEFRDQQMHRQMPDSAGSFGNYPSRPVNNVHHNDGARFHSKPYPPWPPHPAPSDQFSYVHADQHKSQREVPPPSFPNRYHGMHNTMDAGNFYNNHDRMKPGPYENGDNWRHHAPPFPGPPYPDKNKASYPHVPYTGPGPSHEPTRFQNQGWHLPPRAVNHGNPMPMRQPSEGPNFWRPR